MHSSRYSAMWRPACLIIHTGTRSVFSPRAARIRSGSIVFPDASTFVWGIGVADAPFFGAGGAAVGWAEKERAHGAVVAAVAAMARRAAEESFIINICVSTSSLYSL